LRAIPSSVCGLLAAVFLVAGCASVGETKFYTLSGPYELEKDSYRGHSEHHAPPIFIDVMPVRVPERLARPQLVVSIKGQGNQLLILEQARWSSHFNYELRDAFTAAIAGKIGAINVNRDIRGNQAQGQPVYRIAIELSQFDATIGDRVNTRFDWTISPSTHAHRTACYSMISEAAGSSIESLVKGIQNAVTTAAERISENLTELNGSGTATCRP
jgi:uncharacterized lipoprotein YmbA